MYSKLAHTLLKQINQYNASLTYVETLRTFELHRNYNASLNGREEEPDPETWLSTVIY